MEAELENLKSSRYVIKQGSLGTLSDRRLRDIEFELFASLQEVNMEKGRREIMNFLRQQSKQNNGCTGGANKFGQQYSSASSTASNVLQPLPILENTLLAARKLSPR